MKEPKSRLIAIILAILLGGIGIHRFYLGQNGAGILMLLFFWTFIPTIIALIDVIRYALMSEADFQARYSGVMVHSSASATDELEKLAALKEKGHLTQQEFEEKKAKLLAKM
jgi:TM2 domain-containing membrane protein YozV